FIDFCFPVKAFADAGLAQQVDGALFQNARAYCRLNLRAGLLFQYYRFNALEMQQMRKNESCRSYSNDGYWIMKSIGRGLCTIFNASFPSKTRRSTHLVDRMDL